VTGGGTPTADALNWDGDIPFMTPPDLRLANGQEVSTTQRTVSRAGAMAGSATVPAGSVVVSIRAPIGYVGRTIVESAFNQGCRAITPDPTSDARYTAYSLIASRDELDAQGRGTTFMEVSGSQFLAIAVPVPPIQEQQAIADFLDEQTSRIDTLIGKQTQLIDTLRERRTAVTESAVLSGLDRNTYRVPAPVKWLPGAPPSWKWLQLGFVADTLAGYAFPSDGFQLDPRQTRLLRGVNVKPGGLDWTEVVYWDELARPVPEEFRLAEGDVVVGMDRPFVGAGSRVAALREHDLPALLLQRVMRLRAGGEILQEYLRLVLATNAFGAYVAPLFTGVSVPHMSEWQVRKFVIPLPSLEEQQLIVEYLDGQTTKIDALISKAEELIALAQERRAALITAAVTGQIDVRTAERTATVDA